MCGVAGAIGIELPVDLLWQQLHRRGPDELRELRVGGLHAAHSRLAIVAPDDPRSRQPIWYEGRALICNGFIGNADEVMAGLGLDRAASDCTALVASYVADPEAGLRRLRGQFAAVIVDPEAGELVLARDLTGICPLYFAERPEGLVFGSQAAWIAAALRDSRLDPESVDEFLSVGYALAPGTLRAGIRQVEPGTYIAVDLITGKLRRIVRWGEGLLATGSAGSPGSAGERLADLVEQAVARNIGGDYEPWILLSGGLDSLLVLHGAVAAGARPSAVTLAYPGNANADELAMASEFACWYGVELHVVAAEPPERVINPDCFRQRVDWPFDGGSLVPKITMANFIHSHGGRVVLGGTGADELFGGYSRHQRRLAFLPPGARQGTRPAEREFFTGAITRPPHAETLWRHFLEHEDRYGDAGFTYDLLEIGMHHNPRVDSCFANTSVEYRPVFQDADVVALAAALPLDSKSDLGLPKSLLRRAFHGRVPQRFLDVPKKPLRYGEMGPTPQWRKHVFSIWKQANAERANRKDNDVYA
jgi:asparagine synthase (glutamine-hydrolysing)